MAKVLHHKVVASLPAVLEANSIYLVRVGTGFDQYVTNSSGTIVAYPLNKPPMAVPAYKSDGTRLALSINPNGALTAYQASGAALSVQVVFNG